VILDVEADHIFIVSDLHLGSPVAHSSDDLLAFLDHVESTGAALCINGDGFDLLQARWEALIAAALPVIRRLRRLRDGGCPIYYVLGNHDIALEHFLLDLPIGVAPFLNVTSGGRRIRVEHGHLSEPFYARHPDLYELGGRLARVLLFAKADVYRAWSRAQHALDARRRSRGGYPHHLTATALFERGFDVVVFGHTHLPEYTPLPRGLFVNGGDWLSNRTVVEIHNGEVTLHEWQDGLQPCSPSLAPIGGSRPAHAHKH
jgi:UDP-2,3-diacylglucosamine pyrophosphatase LpxH